MKRIFIILFALLFGLNSQAQFLINPYAFTKTDTSLLDTYSADVAFSLRKLRTAYTGYVALVRSGTANAGGNLMFDSNGEISMSSNVIITGVGTTSLTIGDTITLNEFVNAGGANQSAFVRIWYNQGSAIFNLEQITSADQPRLVNAGTLETKNGKPAIYFDGTNDVLLNDGHPVCIEDGNAHSAFGVGSHTGTGYVSYLASANNTPADWALLIDNRTNKNLGFIRNNSTVAYPVNMPSQINNSDLRLLTMLVNSSKAMAGFVNSTTGTTNTYVSPYTLSNFAIGNISNLSARNVNGYISEFIIMPRDEAANRTAIETNINTFYSIY